MLVEQLSKTSPNHEAGRLIPFKVEGHFLIVLLRHNIWLLSLLIDSVSLVKVGRILRQEEFDSFVLCFRSSLVQV